MKVNKILYTYHSYVDRLNGYNTTEVGVILALLTECQILINFNGEAILP